MTGLIVKCKGKKAGDNKYENGFSLVEIITALAILALIIVAFAPLLSSSIGNLARANKMSGYLSTAQGNLAQINASDKQNTGIATSSIDFPVKLTCGTSLPTVNGKLGSTQGITGGFFLSDVPIIEVSPKSLGEGYPAYPSGTSMTVTVFGNKTHFTSGTPTVKLYNKNNEVVTNPTPTVASGIKLTFTIPLGLTNDMSPYQVEVSTTLSSGEKEVCRANLEIQLPHMVTVGKTYNASGITQARILCSSGTSGLGGTDNPGDSWLVMKSNVDKNLNGVVANSSGTTYVAVGDSGTIVTLNDGDGMIWTKCNGTGSSNFNAVTWFDALGMFVAVGDGGVVYTSSDAKTWTSRVSNVTENLTDVACSDSRIIAVGLNGTTCWSDDGQTWHSVSINTSTDQYDFWGICFGNDKFTAVGRWRDKVVVWLPYCATTCASRDGTSWSRDQLDLYVDVNLLDVDYYDKFYAVDNNGYISHPGDITNEWTSPVGISTSNFGNISGKTLNAIKVTENGRFVIVTDDGQIYTRNRNDSGWTKRDASSSNLNDVYGF